MARKGAPAPGEVTVERADREGAQVWGNPSGCERALPDRRQMHPEARAVSGFSG